jgi:threonine dehydratase
VWHGLAIVAHNRMNPISQEDILAAHERIRPFIHRTPCLPSQSLALQAGCAFFSLKCENLQKVGAFKPRGAFNKLLLLQQQPSKPSSVCTHSSGNHAQALAFAAATLGLPAYIVMPHNSPAVKQRAVQHYGATIIHSGNTLKDREETAAQVAQQNGSTFIHPYDDLDIIAGQATAAKEVFEDLPNLDYLVFPIGGGGLSSGCVLSTKYFGGKCRPVGVEP